MHDPLARHYAGAVEVVVVEADLVEALRRAVEAFVAGKRLVTRRRNRDLDAATLERKQQLPRHRAVALAGTHHGMAQEPPIPRLPGSRLEGLGLLRRDRHVVLRREP